MTAYGLSDRFLRDPKYYRFYDPGAYQNDDSLKSCSSPSKVPFLSKTSRNTASNLPVWTHAIYNADLPPKIPNCTSMMSKIPRFPYEALSKEDIEEILCKCGIPTSCGCPIEELKQKPEIICQGKVPRRIIKGVPHRAAGDTGLSTPSKGDHGFEVFSDGSQKRIKHKVSNESPPFYDATVIEATMFYRGCKWSKWSSTRATKHIEQTPGPADYTLKKRPNDIDICAEKVRAKKRKDSKQYRFIEMVQRRNILENAPGPASYTPMLPRGADLHELGPKACRFPPSKYNICPGPADYNPKRHFEPPEPPATPCHAILPEPAFFGIKARRFNPRKEEGPSPATYCVTYKPCNFKICTKAPFGSTVARFQTTQLDDTNNKDIPNVQHDDRIDPCPHYTWEFKSKTMRMKPLIKCKDEPSPADFLPTRSTTKRPKQMQYIAPFFSSDGRFQPWHNWIPVLGTLVTPGPGYYNTEKPKCYPAVTGPLYRDRRFRSPSIQTPGPNVYNVNGGIETILATHNNKLKNNIKNQHQFHFKLPAEPTVLSTEQKESALLNKSIAICEETMSTHRLEVFQNRKSSSKPSNGKEKKKLLRYFLYKHEIPIYY